MLRLKTHKTSGSWQMLLQNSGTGKIISNCILYSFSLFELIPTPFPVRTSTYTQVLISYWKPSSSPLSFTMKMVFLPHMLKLQAPCRSPDTPYFFQDHFIPSFGIFSLSTSRSCFASPDIIYFCFSIFAELLIPLF
jgi:hypothetical protein